MTDPTFQAVRAAIDQFRIDGELTDLQALKRGHIHNTYVSSWRQGDAKRQFIHQRMNNHVFPDLELLMKNIQRVSEHMLAKLDPSSDDGFELLQLVPTRDSKSFARAESGSWRTFVFIENSTSFDRCQSEDQAFEAARAFGWFQSQLRDLPAIELGETLERFFSTSHRFSQFEASLERASVRRLELAADAIAFATKRRGMASIIDDMLRSGEMPTRVVHGDTKLNNILFDVDTGRAKGIVDLDTCMAGYSLYDFGDQVRFTAATSAEDEIDLSKVGTDLALYRALAAGYLTHARGFLTETEIEMMPFSARLVTLTIGLRFLTDYLSGDRYFHTEREDQNLDRAKVQFHMVDFMERQRAQMVVV